MRKFVALFLVISILGAKVSAQLIHNTWIDYSKTYYKFKVGPFGADLTDYPITSGPVRITQSALASAGLGGVPLEQLQLWHNGVEVPIYTSKATGLPAGTDYIEFWGEIADGKLDNEMYKNPALQLNDHWSLETDSSSYFFTVNIAGTNKRVAEVANNAAQATIKADKNFIYTHAVYYRTFLNQGYGASVAQNGIMLYSSSYDRGEGFTSRPVRPAGSDEQIDIHWSRGGIYADTTGAAMTLRANMLGNALNMRDIKIEFNGDSITQVPLNNFNTSKLVINNISPLKIKSDAFDVYFQNLSSTVNDEFRIATLELDYPRLFNFSGSSFFPFKLAASDTGRLIKITNFSTNGVAPVLYDIANSTRYVGLVSGDTISFLLQPSAQQYKLALVRGDGSVGASITSLEKRKFTDYSLTANQGNYLIITNPMLYGSGSDNYVEQYRAYRSSEAGGGFNAKVIDINDLEDQFAFGVKRHPLAIKDFLIYARSIFSAAPANVFLIGKGIDYTQYRSGESDPLVYNTALVPTYGSPGSDNLLSSENFDPVPTTPIGRLSAITPKEVGIYLAKVKQYEAAQQDTTQTKANKGWMKNVLHLTGGNDLVNGQKWDGYMQNYKSIIVDTFYGANVTSFSKSEAALSYAEQVSSFTNIYNQGSSIINYFGHSSSTNLDFSLDNPLNYNNTGKYPLFIVNGCKAGNIFDYDAGRQSILSTISEKFVLAPLKGSIGYESTSSYGDDRYLDIYTKQIYKSISLTQYGKGLGVIMKDAISAGFNITGVSDFYGRIHAEQYTFHGDPALKMNTALKPDYAVFASDITVTPSFVSVADDSFSVKIPVNNLGKAITDSVHFVLYQKFANGDSSIVFSKEFSTLKTNDSVTVTLPLVPNRDKGAVHLTAVINDKNSVAEITLSNNTASISIAVSSDEIRPVYPFNYAIVSTDKVTLAASTANPLDTVKQYIMEMDTTALFNSGVKISANKTSAGGVVEFKNVSLPLNNTVYYWRVAVAGSNKHWNVFSFVHRSGANAGLEQAHYFQHTNSSFNKLSLDSSRKFSFTNSPINLFVKQAVYPYAGTEDADFSIAVNGSFVTQSACVGGSVIFNVFDPVTFKAYANTTNPNGAAPVCAPTRAINFEFPITDPVSRDSAVSFLDNFVHDGDYVVVRNIYNSEDQFAPQWAADTALYGHNNSLYHRLKDQGVDIDSYTYGRCFIFAFKKNDAGSFTPVTVYSQGYYDAITMSQNILVKDTLGYVTSPKFGPAKQWNTVSWQGTNTNANNNTSLNIIGIDKNNTATVLYTIDKTQAQQSIASIDAKAYPYIRLQMATKDSLTAEPYQLNDWKVEYVPVAEGATAANIGVSLPDTLYVPHAVNTQADTLSGFVVFKNVSVSNFDSLKVKLLLYDSTGKAYPFTVGRTKPLVAGDTVKVGFVANVTALPQGVYNLYLAVNPDNDQPEQYLFNNSLYKYVYINRTTAMPVTLVSFSGAAQGKGVMLNWQATNEINFSRYGVERSTDGRTFASIGYVAAQNGAASLKGYNYFDNNPVDGRNYYRLKLIDKDGAFSYSRVISVDFGSAVVVKVYPNPFADQLQVTAGGTGVVRLLDMSGKVIVAQPLNAGTTVIDVHGLAAGTYMVQVNNGSGVQTFKVQKQAK
jgi:hypothetical protein